MLEKSKSSGNALCWLRRDLRLHDHAALSAALKKHSAVYVAFILDDHILEHLPSKSDKRLTFIIESLEELKLTLEKKGSGLILRHGYPEDEIPDLVQSLNCEALYFNKDYEPYAKERDSNVTKKVRAMGKEVHSLKDLVIFESGEVVQGSGKHYQVFTPYKNKWLERFHEQGGEVPFFPCDLKKLARWDGAPCETLNLGEKLWKKIGFSPDAPLLKGGPTPGVKRLKEFQKKISLYAKTRDFPIERGTSLISVYIRHGNVSIRDLVSLAREGKTEGHKVWLSELVWREFYQTILDLNPQIIDVSFKKEYDRITWRGKKEHFLLWCEGKTGYPIIDATMRCFNQTGMMHNRLRMIVASFLCKTLLLNWRYGEKYFAEKLLDYDLAANNGGWQWASSSGCDAQPYFRIFNPYL